jgi:hypothetical protein
VAKPILAGVNLLEAATLSASGEAEEQAGDAVADRDVILPWEDTSFAGTRWIRGDQGASGTQAVSAWGVPAGHSLAGVALALKSSPDDAGYTLRDSVTPTDASAFLRTVAAVTARYWKLELSGAAATLKLAELLLTQTLTLPYAPSDDQLDVGLAANVVRHESVGGHIWSYARSAPLWEASYLIPHILPAARSALEALYLALDGAAKPLLFVDHDGILRWVHWTDAELLFRATPLRYDVALKFREAR